MEMSYMTRTNNDTVTMLVLIVNLVLASASSSFSIHFSTFDPKKRQKYCYFVAHEKLHMNLTNEEFTYIGVKICIYHADYPDVPVKARSEVPLMQQW
jgi:hypothetical protein